MKNSHLDAAAGASNIPKKYLYNILLLAAFIALAINLRAPLTSLPSVIDDIKTELHISSGLAGLLTTIPVLCFGALAPVASAIIARLGIGKAIYLTLCGVALGTLVRSGDGLVMTVTGTILLGIALTLGNIVSLMVIARDFPRHASLITGIYVMAMSIGSMLTAALTVPLTSVMGWRGALAIWGALAALAIALWLGVDAIKRLSPAVAPRPAQAARQAAAPGAETAAHAVWRRPVVWLLSVAFASHTFMFYAMTAWLPDYLRQAGNMNTGSAGMAAAFFQIFGILGCFGVPWLGSIAHLSKSTLFLVVGGAWFLTAAGLLAQPLLWPLWVVLGGIGSGGGFLVVFTRVMDLAGSLDENRRISSFVQGVGYIVASTGPTVVGIIHQLSGNWRGGFILLSLVALLMCVTGMRAAKLRR